VTARNARAVRCGVDFASASFSQNETFRAPMRRARATDKKEIAGEGK